MLVKLKDICLISSSNYNKKDNWDYFNYLDTSNLTNNYINKIQYIKNEKNLPSRAKQKVDINDILFSSVRPNQRHYGFVSKLYKNLLVSTGFIIIKSLENKVNPKYLYYYLTQDKIINTLQNIANNSTSSYPSITKDDLLNLDIELPKIEVQNKICDILSKLDKQIEDNDLMVNKLQVLALKTFDYYSKYNSNINSVVISDILIEREKSSLQVNTITNADGNIPFFTSGETILYTNERLISGFNIFLSTGGNAKVQSYYGDASYSTDTWCISADRKLQYYLFGYLKNIETQMDKLYFHGTGLKHLQKSIFMKTTLNIPSQELLNRHNSIVEPIYIQISKIKQSIIKLEQLKNKLLPILINQQLR